jgi:hypothetical protein
MPANPKDAPFEPADAMCSEVPSVDQRRHTHRHDEPHRPSRKQPPRKAVLTVLKGDARSHNLLEEGLEKGRHRAVPQSEDDDEVLCRNDSEPRPGSLADDQSQSPLALRSLTEYYTANIPATFCPSSAGPKGLGSSGTLEMPPLRAPTSPVISSVFKLGRRRHASRINSRPFISGRA